MDHLLNWLWQGCVVALITAAALRLLQRTRAKARYAVCWISLLVVLLLPLLPSLTVVTPSAAPATDAPIPAVVSVPFAWWTSSTVLLVLWSLWIARYSVRFAGSLVWMRRLVAASQVFPGALESRLTCWNRVRTCRPHSRLVLSDRIGTAAVVGCAPPVIAIAPTLLHRLTPEQLDGVVIHEWAHVQRRDNLLNVAHVTARAIAGWHPGVWWLERQLQIEREAACDELAIGVTGSARDYAACLATLASLVPARIHALPAIGILASPALRDRVSRILSHKTLLSVRRSTAAATAVVLILTALSPAIASVRLVKRAAPGVAIAAVTAVMQPQGRSAAIESVSKTLVSEPAVVMMMSRPTSAPSTASTNVQASPLSAASAPTVPPAEQPLTMHVSAPPLEPLVRSAVVPIAIGAPKSSQVLTRAGQRAPFWEVAADGGAALGKVSQRTGVATAGFFTRFGKRVAASF